MFLKNGFGYNFILGSLCDRLIILFEFLLIYSGDL